MGRGQGVGQFWRRRESRSGPYAGRAGGKSPWGGPGAAPSNAAPRRAQEGFTLLEVIIAATVLLITMVAVGTELGTQTLSVGAQQAQQNAANLVDQTIEQIRALPYQLVANGLSTTDATIASDPNISVSGTAPNQTYTFVPTNEAIPHGSLSYTQAPLVPHQSTASVHGTTFTLSTYPTIDSLAGTDVIRVSVIVSWKAAPTWELHEISSQTLVFSASTGCLTSTNHPFAAPCQPFLYGNAVAGQSDAVSVTFLSGTDLSGLGVTGASLSLGESRSNEQIEQTSSVVGTVLTSLGIIGSQSSGGAYGSSTGDNDPGTSHPTYSTSSVSQTGSGVSVNDNEGHPNSVSVVPGPLDAGTTVSSAAAATSQGCDDLSGAAQNSALPCGSSAESASGQGTLSGTFWAVNAPLGSVNMASVASQPAAVPNKTFVGRYTTAGGTYCPNTSGDGCVHVDAERSLGTFQAIGLPSQFLTDNSEPAGWGTTSAANYLFELTNYSAAVSAESGKSAAAPSAAVPAPGQPTPVLSYWNGTGYTALNMTWGSTAPTITIPAVTATDNAIAGGAVTVSIATSIVLGQTTTAATSPSGCTTPCTASASASAPVNAEITYTVTQETTTLASFEVQINLGDLLAATSYQAAP